MADESGDWDLVQRVQGGEKAVGEEVARRFLDGLKVARGTHPEGEAGDPRRHRKAAGDFGAVDLLQLVELTFELVGARRVRHLLRLASIAVGLAFVACRVLGW